MGLKPREVDVLTPAEFTGLFRLWKRQNLREEGGPLAAPTEDEVRAAEEAERMYGGGA
jgi:hypothetical protein